ncbi:MAG: phosphotransferase, partial [Pseudomonadales bacterium]
LTSRPSLMLVDSPPKKERNLEYVRVNDYLASHKVRVPHMHAVSFEHGLLVLEDLGEQLLQNYLTPENARQMYSEALDMLYQLQMSSERPDWLQDYSPEYLLEEMQLFPTWFVQQLLGIELDSNAESIIENTFASLIESAMCQPQVFVHRDFHCRNLMVLPDNELATIDFQDAVWGPVTYDLVSLCKDCYLRWPEQRVREMVQNYADRLLKKRVLTDEAYSGFERSFDLMGLQRHIKVLGIFARLYQRDGKSRYLSDLPLVLRYTLETTAKYPEFKDFRDWMLEQVLPLAAEQSWYQDWHTAGRQLEFQSMKCKREVRYAS